MDGRNASSRVTSLVPLHESTTLPLDSDLEVGIAASLYEAEQAAIRGHVISYAQISASTEPLVLLTVERDPREFHKKLETCLELKCYRDNLESAGKNFVTQSGGYIFVRPEQYETALEVISLYGVTMSPHHILVAQEYEKIVLTVIGKLRSNLKVRILTSKTVPVAMASWLTSSGIELHVSRTFLQCKITSSIRSTPISSNVVASTTDAHGGKNPRRA
jgi:hypothetical protein